MSLWQQAKLKARQKVHDTFAFPAVFYATSASVPTVVDDVVSVRYHDKTALVGDLAGTNLSYAESAERPAQVIFQVSEMEGRGLSRGSMVVGVDYAGRTVGYYIDTVDPDDGLTVTATVVPLSTLELAGKLLPDGSSVV